MLKNKFNELFNLESRGGLLKFNIFTAFFVKGASMLISLVFVPLVLAWLGKYSYGIWLTINSMVGWLSFMDIGLSGGLRLRLQESMTTGEKALSKMYISTTYASLAVVTGLAFLATILFMRLWNPDLCSFFQVDNSYEGNLWVIIYFTIGCFFLRLVLQSISTILLADQRNFIQSITILTENLLNLAGIFIFKFFFPSNLVLACILFSITPIFNLLIYTIYLFATRYKEIRPSMSAVNFSYIKSLMTIGVDVFIINITLVLAGQLSNFIITKFFSPNDVTDYNLVFRVFSVIGTLYTMAMTPVWSAFANAYYKKDYTWITNMLNKLLKSYSFLIVVYISLIFVGPFIVRIWSGIEVTRWDLYVFSAVYYIVQSFMTIYAFMFNGMGVIRLQRNMAIFGAIVNVPTAYVLIRYLDMGPSAAIIGTIVAILPSLWLYPLKAKSLLKNIPTSNSNNF